MADLDLTSLLPALGIVPSPQPAPVPAVSAPQPDAFGLPGLAPTPVPAPQGVPLDAEPAPAPTPLVQGAGLEPPADLSPELQAPAESPLLSSQSSREGTRDKVSQGAALGTSAGHTGFDPAADRAIQAGPRSRLDKRIARAGTQAAGQFTPVLQASQEATQAGKQAAASIAEVEAAQAAAVAPIQAQIAGRQQEYARQAEAAQLEAQLRTQGAIQDYRAALADYSAANVNPAQLWEAGGTRGQFGMIATAFAHDFLGAKGIKTSGMESLNLAIQRNIAAQMEGIRKKGEVAAGFKTLWDMQRIQSTSDQEAAARIHGFYLEAFKQQIVATLSGYDSKLALAKGQAALVELDKLQAKNMLDVQNHIADASNQAAQLQVTAYGQELQAATSRDVAAMHIKSNEAMEQARLKAATTAAQAKAAKEAQEAAKEGLVFDTSIAGGNTAIRRYRPDIPKEKRAQFSEQSAAAVTTAEQIHNLINLQDQVEKVAPVNFAAAKKMRDEAQRAAEQVRLLAMTSLIRDNTGKAANETEFKIYNDIFSQKDWWLNGDNVRTLSILAESTLRKNNAIIGGVSDELKPDDPYFGYQSGTRAPGGADYELAKIRSAPGAGAHVNTPVEDLVKEVEKPVPDVAPPEFEGAQKTLKSLWDVYRESQPKDPKATFDQTVEAASREYFDPRFAGLYELAKLADQPAAEGSKEAREQLENFASRTNSPYTPGYRGLTKTQQELADESAFLLKWIQNN